MAAAAIGGILALILTRGLKIDTKWLCCRKRETNDNEGIFTIKPLLRGKLFIPASPG
jgi:hypothetical protein